MVVEKDRLYDWNLAQERVEDLSEGLAIQCSYWEQPDISTHTIYKYYNIFLEAFAIARADGVDEEALERLVLYEGESLTMSRFRVWVDYLTLFAASYVASDVAHYAWPVVSVVAQTL